MTNADVAIVDYGLGNLFSVKQACEHVGLSATISRDPTELRAASGLVLPGVGAFGRAMERLRELNLVEVICEAPASGRPLIGICLGAQLLMSESTEFGHHEGLDLIPGNVRRLDEVIDVGTETVPRVGWGRVNRTAETGPSVDDVDLLTGVPNGEYLYFVHSYCIQTDDEYRAALSGYGGGEYCSAVSGDHVVGFQFHPERSGPAGLRIYRNIRTLIKGGESGA